MIVGHPRFKPTPLLDTPPSLSCINRIRRENLSRAFSFTRRNWDRVNVLGDDSVGHWGCVNALSWAKDGELLISGGDDRTIQIWRMDSTITEQDYPFTVRAIIQTGHRANIFNAHMLPYSSRIVSAAGDKQIRVHDIGEEHSGSYRAPHPQTHVIRCHKDRVKRITTEDSPNLFLSVSEDGTVRQHDLRTTHSCRTEDCPPPLVELDLELSTLALSPLTPYQFVVAGDSSYGYLFDRRNIPREHQVEWGMVPNGLTTCVRRFGLQHPRRRKHGVFRGRDHITGARMSAYNGHEVLLSYSGDAVYLFSTLDDPGESHLEQTTAIVPPNSKTMKAISSEPVASNTEEVLSDHPESDSRQSEDEEMGGNGPGGEHADNDALSEDYDVESASDEDTGTRYVGSADKHICPAPITYPRQRYIGARNVETVKDVNFLGPHDEYVTSGSDDGNFFVWSKTSGVLRSIFEGDSQVTNVVEAHPHLPLVAASGIDRTVKLFAPIHGESAFSRMVNADNIIRLNTSRTRPDVRRFRSHDILSMLGAMASIVATQPDEDAAEPRGIPPDCNTQ